MSAVPSSGYYFITTLERDRIAWNLKPEKSGVNVEG